MASFEKRFDSTGRLQAIRVKVRLAGLPHLSKTVRVIEDSPAAIAKAEASARTWEAAAVQALVGGRAPNREREGGTAPDGRNENPSALGLAWADATDGGGTRSVADGDTQVFMPPGKGISNADQLLLLLAAAGLHFEEMAALRWRHVHLEAGHLEVPGAAGYVIRQVPLTSALSAALLGLGRRKHGLVFGQAPLELAEHYRALTACDKALSHWRALRSGA